MSIRLGVRLTRRRHSGWQAKIRACQAEVRSGLSLRPLANFCNHPDSDSVRLAEAGTTSRIFKLAARPGGPDTDASTTYAAVQSVKVTGKGSPVQVRHGAGGGAGQVSPRTFCPTALLLPYCFGSMDIEQKRDFHLFWCLQILSRLLLLLVYL